MLLAGNNGLLNRTCDSPNLEQQIRHFAGKKLTIKSASFEKTADILKMTSKTFTFRYEGGQAQIVYDYSCDGKRLSVNPRVEGGQPMTFEKR